MSDASANQPVIGIDVGGTNMQAAVVDADGRIAARHFARTRAERSSEAVIADLAAGAGAACAEAGVRLGDVAGVGVAAAGAIDVPARTVLHAPNLRWFDVPLGERLEALLEAPVVVENDVNAAVWGESLYGAAKEAGDTLGVWIGTGVGGGLVLNGAIYHGALGTAGEVGHSVIMPDNPSGKRTVEELCSRTAVLRAIEEALPGEEAGRLHALREAAGGELSMAALAEAYHAGDPLAVATVDASAEVLGIAIAGWVTVLALDMVMLGGGMSESLGEPYLDIIRRRFEREVFPARCRQCRIVTTALRADAGLLGAAALALARGGAG